MYALDGLGLTSTWTADDYRRWAAKQAARRVAAKRRPASYASAATAAVRKAFKKARRAKEEAAKLRAGSASNAASSAAAAAQAYREWKALQWAKKYIPLNGLGLAPIAITPVLRAKPLNQAARGRRQVLAVGRRPWIYGGERLRPARRSGERENMAGLGEIESVVGGVLAVGAVAAAAYFLFGKQLGLKSNPRRRRRSRRRSRRR